jgi:hypothetical protein
VIPDSTSKREDKNGQNYGLTLLPIAREETARQTSEHQNSTKLGIEKAILMDKVASRQV